MVRLCLKPEDTKAAEVLMRDVTTHTVARLAEVAAVMAVAASGGDAAAALDLIDRWTAAVVKAQR